MYLIDKVLDGAGKNEVDFVHVPAEPVCHLSHLVRPNEVDCRVDHPALKKNAASPSHDNSTYSSSSTKHHI